MSRKELKGRARQNLLGRYGCAIGALIIVGIVSFITSYFSVMISGSSMFYIAIGCLGTIIFAILGILLQAGVSYVHLRIARGQEARAVYVSFAVKHSPVKYIGYGILEALLAAVCITPGAVCLALASMQLLVIGRVNVLAFISVPLLAIGCIILIVVLLSWQLTVYILLDYPSIRVMEAIRKSRTLMRGNRGRLFVLWLSFIGWYVFSILTLFIGLLWIQPYVSQTLVCFYLSLLPNTSQN